MFALRGRLKALVTSCSNHDRKRNAKQTPVLKNNISMLNNMYFPNSVVLSDESLLETIEKKWGRKLNYSMTSKDTKMCLHILNEVPVEKDKKNRQIIAEFINSCNSAGFVKTCIENCSCDLNDDGISIPIDF